MIILGKLAEDGFGETGALTEYLVGKFERSEGYSLVADDLMVVVVHDRSQVKSVHVVSRNIWEPCSERPTRLQTIVPRHG